MMKNLRAILQFAQDEQMIGTTSYRKLLFVTREEVPIITLAPERLQLLIYDEHFRNQLKPSHQTVLDIFIFGCTVALRFSDLIGISRRNIEIVGDSSYLCITSIKTSTTTRIRLPDYALKILARNACKGSKTIFARMSLSWFNIQVRKLCETAGWNEDCGKHRLRNGKKIELKTAHTGKAYRFCDLVSSHVMRRTAISTMLIHGVPEVVVRKISGHSANSLAFQRYVNLVQAYLDKEIEKHFAQLLLGRQCAVI